MWSEFIAVFLFFVFLIIGNFKGIRYEINDFSSLECVVMQISKVPEYFFYLKNRAAYRTDVFMLNAIRYISQNVNLTKPFALTWKKRINKT